MRKLFVLFLLVALVPFTVGCNGLWDFDDDDDPVAAARAKVLLTPSVTVPSSVAATLRAVVSGYDIPMTVGGVTAYPVTVTTANNVTTLQYSFEVLATALGLNTTTTTSATVPAVINVNGTNITVNLNVSNVSTAATAVVSKVITITDTDNDGVLEIAVANDTATQTQTQTAPVTTGQYITSVKYGTDAVSTTSTTPTTVTTITPMFSIGMNEAVTAINAWTFTVTNVTTGASFDMALADGLVTAVVDATDATNKTIKVTVVGGNGKTLDNGSTYKVEYKTGTINGTAFTKAVAPRYIKVVVAAQ